MKQTNGTVLRRNFAHSMTAVSMGACVCLCLCFACDTFTEAAAAAATITHACYAAPQTIRNRLQKLSRTTILEIHTRWADMCTRLRAYTHAQRKDRHKHACIS